MSRKCMIMGCLKHPRVANNVSHAKNRTKKWVYPNVHKMRFRLVGDPSGKVYSGNVCTKCVKAGKVEKVI